MNMKRIALFALLLVVAVAANAQSLNWPVPNHGYYCSWSKPDPNHPGTQLTGTATVTFVDLAGNNYLRRGILRNEYPTGAVSESFVTVTKPVILTPDTTQFELTTSTGIQCKNFLSQFYSFYLYFDQCSNGAQQWCSF